MYFRASAKTKYTLITKHSLELLQASHICKGFRYCVKALLNHPDRGSRGVFLNIRNHHLSGRLWVHQIQGVTWFLDLFSLDMWLWPWVCNPLWVGSDIYLCLTLLLIAVAHSLGFSCDVFTVAKHLDIYVCSIHWDNDNKFHIMSHTCVYHNCKSHPPVHLVSDFLWSLWTIISLFTIIFFRL